MGINDSNIEKPTFIDLFCGAGGMSLGFEEAGFQGVCVVDFHSDPLKTYELNRVNIKKKLLILNEDIRELKGDAILTRIAKKFKRKENIDVIIGGPPCQGFSLRGKRNKLDPRNNLLFEFFRLIEEIKPEIFVFENVPGLLMKKFNDTLKTIFETITSLGYRYGFELLNSADYGVPQNRERFIIIGSKSCEKIYFPKQPQTRKSNILNFINRENQKYDVVPYVKRKVTAFEALDDIAYKNNEENPTLYSKTPIGPFQENFQWKKNRLYNHITTKHSITTRGRFSQFKQGYSMKDIPEDYRTKRSSVQRMYARKPTRTITSCNEDFIHYSLNRIITIREMARLQSYPDNYVFYGTPTTGGNRRMASCCQVQQVGNSVPPLLGQAIAECVRKMLGIGSNNKLKNFINILNKRGIINQINKSKSQTRK